MSGENSNPNQYPLGEPSVLDYVKSLFHFGNGERLEIPSLQTGVEAQSEPAAAQAASVLPWRSLLALGLALSAQSALEHSQSGAGLGLVLYFFTFTLLGWAIYCREWTLAAPAKGHEETDPLT